MNIVKPFIHPTLSLKLCFAALFICTCFNSFAQNSKYSDGRPSTDLRVNCIDYGVVLTHGGGPDSCDTYGAREAIVNRDKGIYYLFYDGAGNKGWIACLAESRDLKKWVKKGTILTLGDATKPDHKSASAPWVIKQGNEWHMFYLGTPNTTPAPDRIPSFPYLTMKAKASKLTGPWIKQYGVRPFPDNKNSFYTVTSSPGFIIKYKGQYLQFFSGATQDSSGIKRTLGLAVTKNLDRSWTIREKPIFPSSEQVENSSVYFDAAKKTWYLFTNHIGLSKEGTEYTDAIWMYWSKDVYHWNSKNKAVVLDSLNCTWAKGAIGMPSVIKVGHKLAVLYDGTPGNSISHMGRNIGLAWISLPIIITKEK